MRLLNQDNMIEININNNAEKPIQILKNFYDSALSQNQRAIEAIVISSIGINKDYADARYVNLKYITNDSLIFFSNYESNKGIQFDSNNNCMVTAVFYWERIDVQIRMRGKITKLSKELSDKHYMKRDKNKNALAISSNQSKKISGYDAVMENYEKTLNCKNLSKRPHYWGGYCIKPVYFEFWEAHKYRLNRREVHEKKDKEWIQYFLQP